jgi:hypothetical protein
MLKNNSFYFISFSSHFHTFSIGMKIKKISILMVIIFHYHIRLVRIACEAETIIISMELIWENPELPELPGLKTIILMELKLGNHHLDGAEAGTPGTDESGTSGAETWCGYRWNWCWRWPCRLRPWTKGAGTELTGLNYKEHRDIVNSKLMIPSAILATNDVPMWEGVPQPSYNYQRFFPPELDAAGAFFPFTVGAAGFLLLEEEEVDFLLVAPAS